MEWSSFLIQVASRSTGAAAGAAALPAGPLASAAAGALTSASTQRLLGDLVEAQTSQLRRFEDLNRDLQGRLARLEVGMETLLNAPIKQAMLHVEQAQRQPKESASELTLARTALFAAWSMCHDDDQARRIVVAQQLSVVFALLGDTDEARRWLVRSYADAIMAVRTQAEVVQRKIEDQVVEATRVRRSEKVGDSVRSSKGLARDAAFIASGYGIYALASPKYRARLARLRAERNALKAELEHERVAARLQAVDETADEARAILELQRDADAVREACLQLGATAIDVPYQSVQIAASPDDIVQISVVA